MKDKLLEMFFQPERWEKAIEKGVDKDIRRDQLIKLASPQIRLAMYEQMKSGKYLISPPHTAAIPKDDGTDRIVYVNEPIDRIVMSICNDMLFELTHNMIHKSCKAYRKGIGCGKVVIECSQHAVSTKGKTIGFKSDLSKYFDSVPREYIHKAFDDVEEMHGKSVIIDMLRKYYDSDLYFDVDGKCKTAYQSLKQGCAVASWLADVVLYHVDKKLSDIPESFYARYCDDMLFIGRDYKKAMDILQSELAKMGMKLNPKKVEFIENDKWFKFLGFNIKGSNITFAKSRLKSLQKEIEKRTFKNRKNTVKKAVNSVNNYLYKGNGEFSWATAVLPVVNVKHDIDEINKFVMDCIKAVETGKHRIGGLGCQVHGDYCVLRGKGRNVRANRSKVGKIEGYISIGCMQNAILTRRAVFNTLVASL